jgi:DNA-directed RNA polymerase specialized sigma24 family protein
MVMAANNQQISEYLLLIKKLTNIKIKNPNHHDLKEDVVQDVCLKLYKSGFFNTNDLNASEDLQRQINGYIVKAIWSCYMDQLKLRGINRRLTRSEAEESGHRYESIKTQDIDETDEGDFIPSPTESPDQYVFIKEAYEWIADCFNSATSDMKDTAKQRFLNAAFWEFDSYGLTIKALAKHLGYTSSNPTQELKRFSEKVSLCTGPHGIFVNNPHEQIQFLREKLTNTEVGS